MPQTTDEILHGATRGAKYNVVLQVVFRVVTFGMNAVVLRYVSKATLGIANVRLMLLYTTALLFSREAIRKASLDLRPRYDRGEHAVDVVQCRNLSWCSVPAGVVVTALLVGVWTKAMYAPEEHGDAADNATAGSNDAAYYPVCVLLYAASVLLELLCDSLYIRCQNEMRQRVCVLVEGAAILVRAGVTVGLAIARPDLGIVAFGLGQLAFSATLCAAYFGYFVVMRRIAFADLLPGRPAVQAGSASLLSSLPPTSAAATTAAAVAPPPSALPPHSLSLAVNLFKQSALKQFLTEGERLIMTVVANVDFEAQGVYDVVCNLGALAARFVFKPVEESYYVFFAKIISRDDHDHDHGHDHERGSCGDSGGGTGDEIRGGDHGDSNDHDGDHRHHHPRETTEADLRLAAATLAELLWFVSLVGLTVLAYGQAYSRALLHLYGGATLSEGPGPQLLRTYCAYVLALAVNGITECFVFATAPAAYVSYFNRVLVGLSVVFLAACWVFTKLLGLGAVGFIFANCVNMVLRIGHHLHYISGFFSRKQRALQLRRVQGTARDAAVGDHPPAAIGNPLRQGHPSWPVLLSFGGAYAATTFSEGQFYSGGAGPGGTAAALTLGGLAKHVAVGCACLAAQAALVLVTDGAMLRRVRTLLVGGGRRAAVAAAPAAAAVSVDDVADAAREDQAGSGRKKED